MRETHGFAPLVRIDPADYEDVLTVGGMTALFDSTYALTESVIDYGTLLMDQDYTVNGIVFVITDGYDNQSRFPPRKVRELKQRVARQESLESLMIVLIGIDADRATRDALASFRQEADLDAFLDIGQATPANLARLAALVSASISSQSRSLAGGDSAILRF